MLGLSDNELQRLNSDLSNLVNLVELDISRNGELSIYCNVIFITQYEECEIQVLSNLR